MSRSEAYCALDSRTGSAKQLNPPASGVLPPSHPHRALMKPQARPFTVETKSKRRPLRASHTNWTTLIDEPSPDDLPSRNVGQEAAAGYDDTPLAVANRAFSAFATNALSAAASLFTPGVFAPQADDGSASDGTAVAVTMEERRTGRVLPSLVPVSRFDEQREGNSNPAPSKLTKQRRPRSRAASASANEILRAGEGDDPPEHRADAPEPSPPNQPDQAETVRKPSKRKAEKRVPAGERWKRRRLPKACW